ncbi:MAG: GNAT family N-acetyltransferase [Armatimonadetes bacterium]|nr:GNAT family N-acetyltransferase [Armatimonadota bacterium]
MARIPGAKRGSNGLAPQNTVASLYVHPDFYRQGLGTALLRACANKALERGHEGMMIGVFRDNVRAKNFYLKLGAELFKAGWFAVDGIKYPEEILIFTRGSEIFLP